MLEELKKEVEKVKKTMYEQNGNIHKEIENLKRNQREILKLKNIMTEMKNSVEHSKADLSRQKRESINLKIGQWKCSSLRNRKKRD